MNLEMSENTGKKNKSLKKRKLGKTNISVSELGLGCWALGGLTTINEIPITYGNVNEKTAINIISYALKLGITTFDTADTYSLGNSEKILGKVLKKNRKNIQIFTKAGGVPSYGKPMPMEIDLSSEHLIAALRRSLKRLDTTYVDLFQAHKAPQSEKEFAGLEHAFNKIKSENLAHYCGVSIGLDYKKGIELINRGIVDTIQCYFSLIDPKPIEELLPLAKKKNIGIIIAEPLAQGFLSGKYKVGHIFPKNDIRSISFDKKALKKKLQKSEQFQKKFPNDRLNILAIQYILSRIEVSTCIPGSKSISQLKSNVNALDEKIKQEKLVEIKKIQEEWKN